MFRNLFKKKSELEKLQEQRKKLLSKAHTASTVNRTLSDKYMLEIDRIDQKIDDLLKKSK
jgi:hypothetical protein